MPSVRPEMMNDRPIDVIEFKAAVKDCFAPFASRNAMQEEWWDSRLAIYTRADLCMKVYLPQCHGHSVVVTLAPHGSPGWNAPDELGFTWVGEFLGLKHDLRGRVSSAAEIRDLVREWADETEKVVKRLSPPPEGFSWQAVYKWHKEQIRANKGVQTTK